MQGYHGDTSATFHCGEVEEEAKNLVLVTKECLYKAIAVCAPGVEFKKIGRTIHDHADKYRYGVVQQFVGHGVGRVFHADPVILHFRNNEGGHMVLGQTFTIEPMLTIGSINPVMWDDNWTVVTEDGSLSAQFEHTILITEDGAEILTQCLTSSPVGFLAISSQGSSSQRPTFSVAAVCISQFNVTSSKLNSNLDLMISIHNPNKKLVFFYDPSIVTLNSDSVYASNGTFSAFLLKTKNTTVLKTTVLSVVKIWAHRRRCL
ncbi:hypothetical protein NE237_023351 [Protea cynaroides]|uniref:Peptidase M24 domain-containing protein n=1 Tax=Protea cynaroides TaxID=273540 RepID=A0A9Q0HBK2_9MAGN|nr:hypothetical protein NE237_023351 [Protea cynaroides]